MKIVCPKCGEIKRYGRMERVHRMLLYDNNDEPCGATEDIHEWGGIPRCPDCNSKVKLINQED